MNKKSYLTKEQLKLVLDACDNVRDLTLCRLSYRHGLRCNEALNLTWDDINFNSADIMVKRSKNGIDRTHPLNGDELRLLRKLKRENKYDSYLFESRKSDKLTTSAVRYLMKRLGDKVSLPHLHHHQFRHSCGYHMAKSDIPVLDIQQWLGHRNIENTMVYIDLAGKNLKQYRDWSVV